MTEHATGSDRTRLAIIGATGLVGVRLIRILDPARFTITITITVVGRCRDKLRDAFPNLAAHMTWTEFEASDAQAQDVIVNLAGSSVSAQKWTAAYKQTLFDSRLDSTRLAVDKCRQNSSSHLINASAVSAYGFSTEAFHRFTEQDRDQRAGPQRGHPRRRPRGRHRRPRGR